MADKKEEIVKTGNINIAVGLDKDNVPIDIKWKSDDSAQNAKEMEAKAFLLSIFDMDTKDTLKIDLWTNALQVVEMDRFMFQTLKSMADTYMKATNNKELAEDMRRFVQYFGEKTEIVPKEERKMT